MKRFILLFVCFFAQVMNAEIDSDWDLLGGHITYHDIIPYSQPVGVWHEGPAEIHIEPVNTCTIDLNLSLSNFDVPAAPTMLCEPVSCVSVPCETASYGFDAHLKDCATDQLRQDIATNEAMRNESAGANNVNVSTNQRGVDFAAFLKNAYTIDDVTKILSFPGIASYLQELKDCAIRHKPKKDIERYREWKIKFFDALISGHVTQLLKQIQHFNLKIAQAGFDELKKLWHWKRDYTFLVDNLESGSGETGFWQYLGGVDIMKIAEKSLITRLDYIAQHADAQSQKVIEEYREQCYALQQQGDMSGLFGEKRRLYHCITENGRKNDFGANVCFAIVENCLHDPISKVLSAIKGVSSLEKACVELEKLEIQMLNKAQQKDITLLDKVKEWTINQYGYDVLDAARNLYQSRADYVAIPANQSVLSDDMRSIVDNIAVQDLSMAHAELMCLETQIAEGFEGLHIVDPAAQKELLIKNFGTNILDVARKKYQERLDHIDLVKNFIPLDVQQTTIEILETNDTYAAVADQMTDVADNVFANARLCNLSFVSQVEPQVYNSLEAMRIAQDCPTFIVNFAIVSNTIGDVQALAWAIVKGEMALLVRAPELLDRAIEKFLIAVNPITQTACIVNLAGAAGGLLKKGIGASVDALLHPITTTKNGITITVTAGSLLLKAGRFVSDVSLGIFYLPPAEYQKRINTFCETVAPIKNVTAEHVVDFVAHVAADGVFLNGLGRAYSYLKELDVIGKMSKYTAPVAQAFKKAVDTHLGDSPVFATAEGVVIKDAGLVKEELALFAKCNDSISQQIKQKLSSFVFPKDIVQKIRNVGDDILDIMEKAGGHTLERHVGKTYDELLLRSLKIKAEAITTFINKRTALNAVKENLKHNAEKISSWLNNSLEDQIVIEFLHSNSIGMGILKGKKNPFYDLTSSKMVLEKNVNCELGFNILTAFPIIK